MYLFFRNEPRIRHNLIRLSEVHDASHPVAFCKPTSTNVEFGKAISNHFDNKPPDATYFCVGSQVAIDNRNFCPDWGLFNGAIGTVVEIVFDKGNCPNTGSLPAYVVVNFPNYKGPVWDSLNPQVRFIVCFVIYITHRIHPFLFSMFLFPRCRHFAKGKEDAVREDGFP